MCRRNHLGQKTPRRERIKTNIGNAHWLAERYEAEALKGANKKNRAKKRKELFTPANID